MPEVVIGARTIEYSVRRSDRAGKKRIEVTSGSVDVIVPADTSADDIEQFVESKRRWLHDKTEEIQEEVERLRAETPEGFHSGAKILFRGRYLKLRIESADVEEPSLSYRTAFHVTVPRDTAATERERIARRLVRDWMEERLAEDAWDIIHRCGEPCDLEPRGVRIKDQQTLWGSCGRDRVLRLDRKLVRVPKPVLEYVVVHELCHLRYRDHSDEFWGLVKRILPDYGKRKEWLEEHEVRVG